MSKAQWFKKRAVFFILLFCLPSLVLAELSVHLSPSTLKTGELIRLTLRLKDATTPTEQPDLTPLLASFTIAGSESRSSYTFNNGKASSFREWTILLVARKSGILTIPALKVGSETTKPQTVEVLAADAASPGENPAAKDLFIKTEMQDTDTLVGQQLGFTVRIFIKKPLMEAWYTPPKADNALLLTLGKEQQYQTEVNGQTYTVSEQKYVLFPQKSGTVDIIPAELTAMIYQQFPERITARADPISVKVKPLPQDHSDAYSLPAKDLKVTEDYIDLPSPVKQGAAFTREIRLQARGIPAQLIPALSLKSTDGLTVYPEKISESNEVFQSDIVGIIKYKVSYLVNHSGSVQIPALTINWYNTLLKKQETAILPARSLNVLPGSLAKKNAGNKPADKAKPVLYKLKKKSDVRAEKSLFPWLLAAGFALIWVLTLVFGWLFFRKTRPHSRRQILKKLKASCLGNQAKLAREWVILWAQVQWQDPAIRDLEDICARTQQEKLKHALKNLSACLYQQGKATWQGSALWEAIRYHLRGKSGKPVSESLLPPLYKGLQDGHADNI